MGKEQQQIRIQLMDQSVNIEKIQKTQAKIEKSSPAAFLKMTTFAKNDPQLFSEAQRQFEANYEASHRSNNGSDDSSSETSKSKSSSSSSSEQSQPSESSQESHSASSSTHRRRHASATQARPNSRFSSLGRAKPQQPLGLDLQEVANMESTITVKLADRGRGESPQNDASQRERSGGSPQGSRQGLKKNMKIFNTRNSPISKDMCPSFRSSRPVSGDAKRSQFDRKGKKASQKKEKARTEQSGMLQFYGTLEESKEAVPNQAQPNYLSPYNAFRQPQPTAAFATQPPRRSLNQEQERRRSRLYQLPQSTQQSHQQEETLVSDDPYLNPLILIERPPQLAQESRSSSGGQDNQFHFNGPSFGKEMNEMPPDGGAN
ncbi:hypothetical protein FGO68_gene14846 [Halteria grandinella]|uniref:Uncharacterized protein n=1 Tax=Halteria grandinella TaxID=5974 RepID=A0A8J8P3F2_HALGN|nr:hypothetical protein FGO68_gene14846 [Halteria grandinella]